MWERYKPSKPLPVEGGIKTKSKRGEFTNSWWGKRWIEALESFRDAGRLSRGKAYARKGQILDINISKGAFTATVQGSRKKPYTVSIELEQLSKNAWQLVIEAIAQKALYTAKLLAGELPHDIETIFQEINISLLPKHYEDLSTDCSCPDWSNPCKHVAAVLYLLAEEFDRDPFLLFKARGMDRDSFLKELEALSFEETHTTTEKKGEQENPLSDDPKTFWSEKEMDEDYLAGGFSPPSQDGTLLKSLGKFPFWRGGKDPHLSLAPLYRKASINALRILEVETEAT